MYAFLDAHRKADGVEPICRVLPIAPSGYYAHRSRPVDPTRRSARVQCDDTLRGEVRRLWRDHHEATGGARSGSSSAVKASGSPAARSRA
jgi:hypothetical protein